MLVYYIRNKEIIFLLHYRYNSEIGTYTPLWNYEEMKRKILDSVPFDLAVKYDPHWTMGDDPWPYSYFDVEEIMAYMENNGTILNDVPMLWKFNENVISNFYSGFINANQGLIAKLRGDIDFQIIPKEGDDETIISFWAEQSEYFVTELQDQVGFGIISKNETTINKIERILIEISNRYNIQKYRGDVLFGKKAKED